MKIQNNIDFRTFDFYLASTLLALGFCVKDCTKIGISKKVEFIFEGNEKLAGTVKKFWSDDLLVSPGRLFNAQKTLRNRIFSTQV